MNIPEMHLLKISYVGHYLIISTISEIINYNTPISYEHDKINCKWFDYEEAMSLDESKYVHGIKELIPKAFALCKLNYTNSNCTDCMNCNSKMWNKMYKCE